MHMIKSGWCLAAWAERAEQIKHPGLAENGAALLAKHFAPAAPAQTQNKGSLWTAALTHDDELLCATANAVAK